jgi:hypothetical protein
MISWLHAEVTASSKNNLPAKKLAPTVREIQKGKTVKYTTVAKAGHAVVTKWNK